MRTLSKASLVLAAVGYPLCASQAMAQSASDPTGDIVVTAQKRNQGINDVPISISAFSGAKLADAGVKSLENLATITPGLTISETAATGVPIYTIRGIGFSDYSTSASSTVGVYVDEVALPYAVMTRGAFFDTGQVEVLKGPQGDLYGRNSTAGQINVNSARPTDTFKAGLSGEASNYGEVSVDGYVSGPLAPGLKARIAARIDEGGAWQRSISRPGDRLGNKDMMAFRGSLDWQATSAIDVFVSAHYIQDKSDNQAPTAYDGKLVGLSTFRTASPSTTSSFGNPASAFSTGNNAVADWSDGIYRPRRNNRLRGFVARITADLGGANLTSVTGYDAFNRREGNDWDGWAGNESNNINQTSIKVLSEELRLSSKDNGPFTWVVGGYASRDVMHENYNYYMQQSYYVGAIGVDSLATRYDQTTQSLAGFAHGEYRLGGGWRVIAGGRYTHEKRTWSGCTYDANGTLAAFEGLAPGSCGVYDDIPGTAAYGTYAVYTNTITANRFMWKLGLDKKFGRDLVYATVSNGFKSGGFSGINTNLWSQLQPYRPETVTAYEVGAKLGLAHNAVHINVAAFWYDYRNKQETNYINTFVGALAQMTNVPRSRVRGAEVEGHWQATQRLTFDASATWLDATVTSWSDAGVDNGQGVAVSANVAGARLANSPRWQGNLAATYEQPVGKGMTAFGTVDVNARTSYSGRILVIDPATGVAGYAVANARVGIKGPADGWQMSLWVRNLTDRNYYTAAFVGNSMYARMNGMPRSFGISGRVNF